MARIPHTLASSQARRDPPQPRGIFDASDLMWQINREAVLLLAGPRALLMQLAHPLVALGVFHSSDFPHDSIGRLRRTLDAMLGIIFGSREEARAWGDHLAEIHRGVRGVTPRTLGGTPPGTPYSALDPDLLLWVHATLLDSARVAYETFVRSLSAEERDRLYAESRRMAPLLRIPEESLPPDRRALEAFMLETEANGTLEVTDEARALARDVLWPRVGIPLGAVSAPLRFVTAGLLPAPLRSAFELPWSPAREKAFALTGSLVRCGHRLLPDRIRTFPKARHPLGPPGSAS